MKAVEAAFGEEQKEEDLDRHQKAMPRDRFLVAYDGAVPVGTTASLPFELTVPGGELAAGGVTWVGVLPSHRRRGILTQMMKRQLDDLRERGEPLAILWASEAAIYGRFGYGISAPTVQLDADRSRFALRDDPGPKGAVRLIDREEAARVLPPIYDAVRDRVPGSDRKSTRLNSSHGYISYAVFCLKKKKTNSSSPATTQVSSSPHRSSTSSSSRWQDSLLDQSRQLLRYTVNETVSRHSRNQINPVK